MATLKTDRERRILGNRILSNRGEFEAIHPVLGEILNHFSTAQDDLSAAIEARLDEETQDQKAREKREVLATQSAKLYSWAFRQMNAFAMPDWSDEVDFDVTESLRMGLFPLGAPSDLRSTQMIVDGLSHFIAAQVKQDFIDYPAAFIEKCISTLNLLNDAIDAISLDARETEAAVDTVINERIQWDAVFSALRDVSQGLLRLEGKESQLVALFRALPSQVSSSASSSAANEKPVVKS